LRENQKSNAKNIRS